MSLFGQGFGNRGYGFSLKALLEDPNLQNAPPVQTGISNLKKPGSNPKNGGFMPNANSAFLGPNLWEQPSDNKGGDFDLQYMDLDEFLSENGIPVDLEENNEAQTISLLASALAKTPPSSPQRSSPGLDLNIGPISPPDRHCQVRSQPSPSGLDIYLPDSPVRVLDPLSLSPPMQSCSAVVDAMGNSPRKPVMRNPSINTAKVEPQSEIEKCLLDDNFGIKAPVVEVRQKKVAVDVDFNLEHHDMSVAAIPDCRQNDNDPTRRGTSPGLVLSPQEYTQDYDYDCLSDIADSDSECRYIGNPDLAQVKVPGKDNFDPKSRKFSEEELKPQPIIKKSKKVFVDDSAKDDKYWSRRKKNNIAAKRSRDARRVKENQIAMRAAFLEDQYDEMKLRLEHVLQENKELIKRLSKYELVNISPPCSPVSD